MLVPDSSPYGRKVVCYLRRLIAVWTVAALAATLPAILRAQQMNEASDVVELTEIPASRKFPDSLAPRKLYIACADREADLVAHFRDLQLPYRRSLLRRDGISFCHVRYQPSLPGFRALPDSAPLHGLLIDVDPLSLLSQRKTQHGDSLDVAKTILPRIPPSIEVTLGLAGSAQPDWLLKALEFHFSRRPKTLEIRTPRAAIANAWAQDYLKSGEVNGESARLVTRLSLEGRSEYGAQYKPTLDALRDKQTVRSNLSWEGGDLQFHEHPRFPGRTLLFYGNSSRSYWGERLTQDEYAYVLQLEFGADEVVDFSDLVPHVDYFLSVLPEDRVALVSQPVQGNVELARQAAGFLRTAFGATPALSELQLALGLPDAEAPPDLPRVRVALKQSRAESLSWKPAVNDEVYALLESYRRSNCPADPADCLTGEKLGQMLSSDMQLLRAWVNSAMQVRSAEFLPTAMLSVIESQISAVPYERQARIDEKIAELESLGFRVVKVPRVGGDPGADQPWSGISYANAAVIGRTVFVPAFGFGEAEQAIFDAIQQPLKAYGYAVVPVFARYALLQNGGVHCVLGFMRGVPPKAAGLAVSQ